MTLIIKIVIQQVMVLLAVLAVLCSWPAVSGSIKGPAEKLIDERLQMDSLFRTAGSIPPTLTASKPASSKGDTFSSASVWIPKETYPAWLYAWQECNDINCVLEYMKRSGASEEAINFSRKIDEELFGVTGYLKTFEEKGRVDIGSVALPTRANTNGAYVFLNGSPSVLSTEQQVAWMELAESGISWLRCPVFRCTPYGLLATCLRKAMPSRRCLYDYNFRVRVKQMLKKFGSA